MALPRNLAELTRAVAAEQATSQALDLIVDASVSLTSSRNALLAILNEELGLLEVRYVSGRDLTGEEEHEQMEVGKEDREGIMAYVAATGETVVLSDVETDPHYKRLFESTRSEIATPIRDFDGRIRAVFNLESDRLSAYGAPERELVEGISALIALVLARMDGDSREQALMEVSKALDNSLTEEALVGQVIHVAADVLRFQAASLFLHDPSTDTFVLRGSVGRLASEIGEVKYHRGEGCTGWVCDRGEPVLLNDPQKDPRWRGRHLEFPSDQIASFLCVPILSRKQSVGAIRVIRRVSGNRYLDNHFNADDLKLLEAIADQVASGLENVRNLEKIIRSERMIAWGELSAKSSHMIGNRVFALRGDVNELKHVLAAPPLNTSELNGLQKSLETNLGRIEEILQDFRDFVSATHLERRLIDLNELMRETVAEVFPKRSPVALDLRLADDLPMVEADAMKLRRALSELIENSLTWSEDGTLRIQTSVVPRNLYLQTRGSKTKQFARIEIEDSGPGIEMERKSTIFQPFFSGRVKGMGLGLSIVKGIVDAHGGQVFETGELGEGANFVILLPTAERPTP